MDIKELKTKSMQELEKLAAELRAVLRDGRFQLAMRQTKALKKTREARKDLARIETVLNQQP
jgi:ribosomal protein L29